MSSIGRWNCKILMKEKNTLVTQRCVLSAAWFRDLKFLIWGLKIKFIENYFFLENYDTSEGTISHSFLYYQQLPITHYQERFYANKYFELWPIVSTAFKRGYTFGNYSKTKIIKHWRTVVSYLYDIIKPFFKWPIWRNVVLEKEVIFHTKFNLR